MSVFGVILVRIFPYWGWIRKGLSLCIQSEYGKMRTRIIPITDTFYAAYISKSLDIDQMRMVWKRNNSVGKKTFQYHWVIRFWQYVSLPWKYQATQKWNETERRCKTCHIFHINAWNTAYLISYLSLCLPAPKK